MACDRDHILSEQLLGILEDDQLFPDGRESVFRLLRCPDGLRNLRRALRSIRDAGQSLLLPGVKVGVIDLGVVHGTESVCAASDAIFSPCLPVSRRFHDARGNALGSGDTDSSVGQLLREPGDQRRDARR